ncbi:MAG: hypothetical protein ACTSRZ_08045, partial [Promethearchaeota archaeon]
MQRVELNDLNVELIQKVLENKNIWNEFDKENSIYIEGDEPSFEDNIGIIDLINYLRIHQKEKRKKEKNKKGSSVSNIVANISNDISNNNFSENLFNNPKDIYSNSAIEIGNMETENIDSNLFKNKKKEEKKKIILPHPIFRRENRRTLKNIKKHINEDKETKIDDRLIKQKLKKKRYNEYKRSYVNLCRSFYNGSINKYKWDDGINDHINVLKAYQEDISDLKKNRTILFNNHSLTRSFKIYKIIESILMFIFYFLILGGLIYFYMFYNQYEIDNFSKEINITLLITYSISKFNIPLIFYWVIYFIYDSRYEGLKEGYLKFREPFIFPLFGIIILGLQIFLINIEIIPLYFDNNISPQFSIEYQKFFLIAIGNPDFQGFNLKSILQLNALFIGIIRLIILYKLNMISRELSKEKRELINPIINKVEKYNIYIVKLTRVFIIYTIFRISILFIKLSVIKAIGKFFDSLETNKGIEMAFKAFRFNISIFSILNIGIIIIIFLILELFFYYTLKLKILRTQIDEIGIIFKIIIFIILSIFKLEMAIILLIIIILIQKDKKLYKLVLKNEVPIIKKKTEELRKENILTNFIITKNDIDEYLHSNYSYTNDLFDFELKINSSLDSKNNSYPNEGNIQIYQQNDLNKTNALKKYNVAIVKDQNSSSSDK